MQMSPLGVANKPMQKSAIAKDNTNQLLVTRRRRLKTIKYTTRPFPAIVKTAMTPLMVQYHRSVGSSKIGPELELREWLFVMFDMSYSVLLPMNSKRTMLRYF